MAESDSLDGTAELRRSGWRRTLKVVLTAAILYFFVIPLIPGFRRAVDELNEVEPSLLAAGIALQAFSLLCYSLLTRAALGSEAHKVSVLRLFRIQLSTKALGNIMPAGSAASSALGYRMLTMSKVPGPDAGFALATAGVGSAVVLNFILWFGLIVSIPVRGVNPVYGTAAIAGVILMAAAGFIVFGLVEGQGRAERLVRAIARRMRLNEHHAAEVLEHLGVRIEGLIAEPRLLARVIVWATLNWILDMASLWVFLQAFGASISLDGLVVAFGLANVLSVVPVTPGGLGIVEGVYIPTLVGFGLTRANATVGVLSYRIAQYWLPILVGWLCYLSLRVGPFAIDRRHRLRPLPEVAEAEAARKVTAVDWVERFAPRDRTGQFTMPTLTREDLEYFDDDTGPQSLPN